MLCGPESGADPAPRPQPGRRTPWSRRRLPSRHSQPAPQTDGAAQPGLSRRAVPARGLSARAWEKLLADGDPRSACKSMVALLALAHDRGCEAELAAALTEQMARPEPATIDVAALQARFAPVPAQLPVVVVNLPSVASYDLLLPSLGAVA